MRAQPQLVPGLQTLTHRNCKKMKVYYFQPLSLCQFVARQANTLKINALSAHSGTLGLLVSQGKNQSVPTAWTKILLRI